MHVTLIYKQGLSHRYPKGTIEIPPHLEIDLEWDDLKTQASGSRSQFVNVSYNMQVALWVGPKESNVRLLGLFGYLENESDWSLASKLVGDDLWSRALKLVEQDVDAEVTVEFPPGGLDGLDEAWQEILDGNEVARVRRLPPSRTEVERDLQIIATDPDFYEKGRALIRLLFANDPDTPQ